MEVVKSVCNVTLDPTKKYLRWEWRFVHGPRKLGFLLLLLQEGRRSCKCLHHGMEWNQIYIISNLHKPPRKSFTPPMVCHIVICELE
jgi:hypothetical protein